MVFFFPPSFWLSLSPASFPHLLLMLSTKNWLSKILDNGCWFLVLGMWGRRFLLYLMHFFKIRVILLKLLPTKVVYLGASGRQDKSRDPNKILIIISIPHKVSPNSPNKPHFKPPFYTERSHTVGFPLCDICAADLGMLAPYTLKFQRAGFPSCT